MKAICYYRHSTDNEQQEQNSIPDQRRQCHQFARRKNWEIVDEVEDAGLSGAGDKIQYIELGRKVLDGSIEFDVLLVRDQSRLSRKNVLRLMEDLKWLEDAGVKISSLDVASGEPKSVDEWANDPAVLMKGWSNNQKVLEASRQSVEGLLTQHANKTLSWIGPAPLGFDKEIKVVQSHRGSKKIQHLLANDELKIVRQIFEEFLNGSSVRGLVAVLQGAMRYKDKFANSTAVKHILRNPIYCGIWAFGKRNVGKHATCNPAKKKKNFAANVLENAASVKEYDVEKAISKNQFLAVQKILDSEQSRRKGCPPSRDYRFTGILKCGACGSAMVAHKRSRKDGTKMIDQIDWLCAAAAQSGHKCRTNSKPFSKSFPEQELLSFLNDFFAEEISFNNSFHLSLISRVADSIVENSMQNPTSREEELAELEIQELEVKKIFEKLHDLPDWLIEKQNAITRKRKELDEVKEEVFTISDYVKAKAEEWIEKGGDEGGRYLNLIWSFAQKLVVDESWNDQQSEMMMKEFYDLWFAIGEKVTLSANHKDEVVGVGFSDPDQLLHVLSSMGLDDISINWKLGKKRGRKKWRIDNLEIGFRCRNLVATNNSTLRVVFNLCNEI